MSSQGQRFRRRALRRGYKVDEVDIFLDRVEATLAGDPLGAPVSGQDVHDVVFRVRFGGYDEWQVDLHLDRVERQLAELEERARPGRAPDPRVAAGRGGPPPGQPDRPPTLAPRPVSPPPVAPPAEAYRRFNDSGFARREERHAPVERGYPESRRDDLARPALDQATGSFDAFEPGRHGKMDMTAEIRMPDRQPVGRGPAPAGPAMTGARSADLERIDVLRRTFQPRRFGSGYDPAQVDGLFEAILSAMSGRGPGPITAADLDATRFSLVPGGYFEGEVDAALKEVRDILRRH